MKYLTSLAAGILFGAGIAISGMINPAKVLNFFDVAGTWDPSLLFVMGGALATAFIGYRVVFGARAKPVYETGFALPTNRSIDLKLVGGSAAFGIGWGIAGFCPGGAVPAIGLGDSRTLIFIAALLAGMIAVRFWRAYSVHPAAA